LGRFGGPVPIVTPDRASLVTPDRPVVVFFASQMKELSIAILILLTLTRGAIICNSFWFLQLPLGIMNYPAVKANAMGVVSLPSALRTLISRTNLPSR
jgi:hypothetical protein